MRAGAAVARASVHGLWLGAALALASLAPGCVSPPPPGPFEQVEEQVWRAVNRNHRGADGLYVQATWRAFAYEIARTYAEVEKEGRGQAQVESRLRELVYSFVDGRFPIADGTDVNNLYLQYLVYIDGDFDPTNPLEKAQFDAWRSEYVRRLMGRVYDLKYPLLRTNYDERWGLTLYSRLVFNVYLDDSESDLRPYVADIGARTFLVDEAGQRYPASGNAGPYPYEFDRPKDEQLDGKLVYRLFFPNRKADRRTPIVTSESKYVELVIESLGQVPERRLRWDLPLVFPEVPMRRLPAAGVTEVPDLAPEGVGPGAG
ncbi:MAG: hypothetical protein ABIL09_26300 [Gemmatimonadota bacterium]